MQEGPKTPVRSNACIKVQAMAQIMEKSQTYATGLNNQKLPNFVYLIS